MEKFRLQRNDSTLMIIDLQERLMQAMKDRERVYKNTNLLLATAQQFDIPVVLSEQYPKGLGPTVKEIKDNLTSYHYLDKTCFSLCNQEAKTTLEKIGKHTIIVTGSETHVCVFQTVRDLLELGFNVHLVRDAVCSRFDENYINALALMRDMGAVITNTETVVFDLLQEAGTHEFKCISPLIK
ncbi:MAG: hydrolase [Syntrophomonas sp.]|uniref:hydrolase n=1 Tax=Syntrophomonas sp. TaxID=2053627 RepID=UPI00260A60C0|nr:hydrolase [Syntrophomonas sp.]MDD2509741.1 hydrolase [Syntrophomonas sp.]MDD3880612.1 hydrolase [Syntrophomonas sp.]MDD4626373.1 hydrolase [Syntrophomonas sp.]